MKIYFDEGKTRVSKGTLVKFAKLQLMLGKILLLFMLCGFLSLFLFRV